MNTPAIFFEKNANSDLKQRDCTVFKRMSDEDIAASSSLSRVEKVFAYACKHDLSVSDVRKRFFMIGNRVYWRNGEGGYGVFFSISDDESRALIETIENDGSKLRITGVLSTLFDIESARVVASQDAGNHEGKLFKRHDLAVSSDFSRATFVPIGFDCSFSKMKSSFWLDLEGASSKLLLSFADTAPITDENKSYAVLDDVIVTSPDNHMGLSISKKNPYQLTKRKIMKVLQ